MKKNTLMLSAVLLLMVACYGTYASIPYVQLTNITNEWVKSKTGIWEGKADGKNYWYKLDKNAKLWWSSNAGKDWHLVDSQMWADRDGKLLKISNDELIWSADMGKTWAPVPDRTWESADGKWYRLDKSWALWINR
jgi:hypothetical protein